MTYQHPWKHQGHSITIQERTPYRTEWETDPDGGPDFLVAYRDGLSVLAARCFTCAEDNIMVPDDMEFAVSKTNKYGYQVSYQS